MFRFRAIDSRQAEFLLRTRLSPPAARERAVDRSDPPVRQALAAALRMADRDRLRRLLADCGDLGVHRLDDAEVRRRLLAALDSGRLVLCECEAPSLTPPPRKVEQEVEPAAPVRPQPPRPTEEETHWIEIVLLGEDEEPLPGFKWTIELPDGELREGVLDERGRARLDDIPGGTCRVSFPELDQDAWEVNTRPPAHVTGVPAR